MTDVPNQKLINIATTGDVYRKSLPDFYFHTGSDFLHTKNNTFGVITDVHMSLRPVAS